MRVDRVFALYRVMLKPVRVIVMLFVILVALTLSAFLFYVAA